MNRIESRNKRPGTKGTARKNFCRRRRWALFGLLIGLGLLIRILLPENPSVPAGAASLSKDTATHETASAAAASSSIAIPEESSDSSATPASESVGISATTDSKSEVGSVLPASESVAGSVLPASESTVVSSPTPSEEPGFLPTATPPSPAAFPRIPLPEGFVHVEDNIPNIRIDMRYFGSHNFIGRPITGYEANTAILTEKACAALARVQASLEDKGFILLILDAYRPTQAVADFVRWGEDLSDIATQQTYYPSLSKADILKDGYVARKSSHSRGSTVDLTLVGQETGLPLDMGCPFDFFGPESAPDYKDLTPIQAENRKILRNAMEAQGFVISSIEWWHFRLKDEPFPKTFFDFPVQ